MGQFQLDPERDPWDRQPGETADQYDWFLHYRNDGERRTLARVAQRFEQKPHRVRTVAHRNQWYARIDAWKAANSAQIQARFREMAEQVLVPWMQGAARMVHLALQSDQNVDPDRALNAATNVIRLAKEPTVSDLIRIAEAGSGGASPGGDQSSVAATIMHALDDHPEARQAAIDAVRRASEQQGH